MTGMVTSEKFIEVINHTVVTDFILLKIKKSQIYFQILE